MPDDTEIRLAGDLERWTDDLDDVADAQLYALIAAAALQLAKRRGFAAVASDLRELAERQADSARRGSH